MTEPLYRNEMPMLFDNMGFRIGAEVGVYKGQFSEILLNTSRLTKLYSIDSWTDMDGNPMASVIKECESRLKKFGDRSEIMRATSVQAASTFPDWFFDFVYIDASHTLRDVVDDIAAWIKGS